MKKSKEIKLYEQFRLYRIDHAIPLDDVAVTCNIPFDRLKYYERFSASYIGGNQTSSSLLSANDGRSAYI